MHDFGANIHGDDVTDVDVELDFSHSGVYKVLGSLEVGISKILNKKVE